MKIIRLTTILIFLILCVGISHSAAREFSLDPLLSDARLTDCIDKNLGYTIKCSPDWNLQIKPRSIVMVIEGTPGRIVTLTVSKSDESGLTLQDLTPSALQYVYEYADSFKLFRTKLGGKKVIRVEGHLADYPKIKLRDYFFIKDTYLYQVRFSVNTEENFEDFTLLFDKLAESFDFFDPQQNVLTLKDQEKPSTR